MYQEIKPIRFWHMPRPRVFCLGPNRISKSNQTENFDVTRSTARNRNRFRQSGRVDKLGGVNEWRKGSWRNERAIKEKMTSQDVQTAQNKGVEQNKQEKNILKEKRESKKWISITLEVLMDGSLFKTTRYFGCRGEIWKQKPQVR